MSLALLLMICRKVDVRVVAFEANLLSHWADTGEPSMRLTTAGKKGSVMIKRFFASDKGDSGG
jgi:hypothetical protein